jgi:hypothetical protein
LLERLGERDRGGGVCWMAVLTWEVSYYYYYYYYYWKPPSRERRRR